MQLKQTHITHDKVQKYEFRWDITLVPPTQTMPVGQIQV